jgi:carboxypeptidase Q
MRSLSDEVGPRLAGSPGDSLAVAWAVRTMNAAGLVDVHTEPVTVPVWQRVSESASLVAPPVALTVTALGGSVSTPKGGVRAEVVRFTSLDALKNGPDLSGKVAFVDMSIDRAEDGHGYGDGVPVRINGAIEAARKGAIAIVIRSIGTDHSRLPHTGVMRYQDGVTKIPAAALSTDDADLLTRTLARDPHALLQLDLVTRELPAAPSANVVGDVPGTGPGIVLLGAHLDSWDLGRGAVDDGAGVGIVLAAARGVLGLPSRKRTVRVVFFAAEENSGAGSKAYAKAHDLELDRHVAALESDHGAGAAVGIRVLTASDKADAARALFSGISNVPVFADDAHGGADVSPLRARGVPILDVLQDASAYFDVHHTSGDVPEVADPAAMAHASCTVFQVAARLALSELELGRIDEAKRKEAW